jgi:GNAT superfamily N-acetyltransferase
MVDVRIVPFNESLHLEPLYELFHEYGRWGKQAVLETFGFDNEILIGGTIEEVSKKVIPAFISLKPPYGIILILEVDGEAMGMGRLSKLEDGVVEINNMFISAKQRGNGYGKLMLNELEETARGFGYSIVRLDTGVFNVAARHMYEKAGYVEREYYGSSPFGRVAQANTEEGKIYYENKIYMEKQL